MSKSEAIKRARELRATGKDVGVYRVSGIYTQPGVGIVGFTRYEVREKEAAR